MPRNKKNKQFIHFISLLSATDKRLFRTEIGCSYSQFRNWSLGNSVIPITFHVKINNAATIIAAKIITTFLGINANKPQINLFKMEKTSIRIELAKKEMQQKDLARALSLNENTLSAIINRKKKTIDLKLAKSIADFFGKKIEDFKEFSV